MDPIVWLVLLGIILAFSISNILSTLDANPASNDALSFVRKQFPQTPDELPRMDDTNKNLFWLVQVLNLKTHYSDHARENMEIFDNYQKN